MRNTKSAIPVGDLGQFATMLVILGIIIGIGSLILTTMSDTGTVSPITYYNDTTITTANNSYLALDQTRVVEIISAGNMTTPQAILTGNFTTIISNQTASSVYFSGWVARPTDNPIWIYYTYRADSSASEALDNTNTAVNIFGDWITIIAIVIVAVVVLTLVKYL